MKLRITLITLFFAFIASVTHQTYARSANPPCTIIVAEEDIAEDGDGFRTVWTLALSANGTYKGSWHMETCSWRTDHKWVKEEPKFFNGTWSTTSRSLGNGSQKVYKVNIAFGLYDFALYIPNNFQYAWAGDWSLCSRNVTNSLSCWKVKSVTPGLSKLK